MLACLTRPTIRLPQDTFRYIFILDITQSMNTRDYHQKNLPTDRFSFSKQALRTAIRELPCGSETGIGLFTTKDILLLLEPLEVCEHFAALDDSIAHIDWRMAWAADSNIERGLYGSILTLKKLPLTTHLVFMTDGEQNIKELRRPPLTRHSGTVRGFIFGVGGSIPAPIPKMGKDNRIVGYWKNGEVDEFSVLSGNQNTSRKKPSDVEQNYLSTLHEPELQMLAKMTGLTYQRLESPDQFSKTLQTKDLAETQTVETDIRWIFALVSLLLVLSVYVRQINTRG